MNIHCNRDYSKCEIYKLVGEGGSVYIGHTTETLETRVLIVVDKANMGKKQKNKILRVLTQNANNLF